MAILTLAEYKALTGIQPADTRNDVQISALLEGASQSVENYVGRKFAANTGIATARNYLYDGSGFLDVDDCTAVTGVSFTSPNTDPIVLESDFWTAMPDNEPIIYYLLLHGGVGARPYFSPEMGFKRNLDQYEATYYKSPTVTVTATWGWPSVPFDVKLATALTLRSFVGTSGREDDVTSMSIESYSKSWGGRTGGTVALAIPNRARDLLSPYQRIFA